MSGLEADFTESFKWYKMAAETGHPMAQNNLGAQYYLGQGVPWPYSGQHKTIFGSGKVASRLVLHHSKRSQVPEDKAMAAIWFEKAAREGNAQSMKNLGKMYAAGDGVPKDEEKSDYWFKKAGMGELYVKGKRATNL